MTQKSKYEIIVNNNHNILFEVDNKGEVFIDEVSLTHPKFDTIGLSTGSFYVDNFGNIDTSGNVEILGNLTVKGQNTKILTTNKYIEDSILELSHGTSGSNPVNDGGFVVNRGDLPASSVYWDESDDAFKMGTIISFDRLTTTIDSDEIFSLTNNKLTIGKLNVDIEFTTQGTSNLKITTNNSINSGIIEIFNGPNNKILIKPNGDGEIELDSDIINIGTTSNNVIKYKTESSKPIKFEDADNRGLLFNIPSIKTNNTVTLDFSNNIEPTVFYFPDIPSGKPAIIITSENIVDIGDISLNTIRVKGLATFDGSVLLGSSREDKVLLRGVLHFTNPDLTDDSITTDIICNPTIYKKIIELPDASGKLVIMDDQNFCDISSNTINFGDSSVNDNITLHFKTDANTGIIKWMEDEDYFHFNDDILINLNEKILFRDTGLAIYSSTDGQLDFSGDTLIKLTVPTIELSSNTINIGNTTNNDITLSFRGNTNTGTLKWMEDEDYFQLTAIDNTQIGSNVASTGSFTTLDASGLSRFHGAITLGYAIGDDITVNGRFVSSLIPKTGTTCNLGSNSIGFNDLYLGTGGIINFGNGNATLTHAGNKLTFGGTNATIEFDFASKKMSNVNIDSGTIDGVTIGGSSSGMGIFTQLVANDLLCVNSNATITGDTTNKVTLDITSVDSQTANILNVKLSDNTIKLKVDSVGITTISSLVSTLVDIGGGAIDETTIGANIAAAGTFTVLIANDSLIVNANTSIIGDDTNEIQLNVKAHVTQSTDIFNVELQDGTNKLTVSSTGVTTAAALVATTVDINGGTIDNTIIGGTTPAAGTLTNLIANDLKLNNSTAASNRINFIDSSNDSVIFIVGLDTSVDTSVWNMKNGYLRFGTNNTENMRISNDGKIFLNNGGIYGSEINGLFLQMTNVGEALKMYKENSKACIRITNALRIDGSISTAGNSLTTNQEDGTLLSTQQYKPYDNGYWELFGGNDSSSPYWDLHGTDYDPVDVNNTGIGLITEYGCFFKRGSLFIACDIRNKHNIKEIDDNYALNIIKKCNMYKFKHNDQILNTNEWYYNVMAQEVKVYFPEAVNEIEDYLADIMTGIRATFEKITDGKYKMTILNPKEEWNIKSGEEFKFLMTNNYTNGFIIKGLEDKTNYRYLKCEEDNTFIVEKEYKYIMLYGRKVKDYLVVDKEKLWSLQHSAIQELSKVNDKQQEEINQLKQENEEMKEKLDTIITKLQIASIM